MNEYHGNVFALMEQAIAHEPPKCLTLAPTMMVQVLSEVAALVEKANGLVRENNELRQSGVGNAPELSGRRAIL